ncbi:Networked 2D [Hibiscus trionum]|uniref:Networked 2D n=1 Tax=Hibiscus trionum TaxID=183268 RepID=A0A9W7GZE1_HIBTR|nr:Networked 2D [Hibiscus trionum]
MLQTASSNAYSWWWASHIRTKQSKWLEHNLQDMEERVTYVLKLVEVDGDSFAQRAEMYFKIRPELIHFVEEAYKAYRALAERYDHLSTELQNANHTIASVFPDQIQFAMDGDDKYGSPSFGNKSPENLKGDIPVEDSKGLITPVTKKLQHKKSTKDTSTTAAVAKSGSTKAEGIEEIDKLHKRILALRTEKEFAKSCYESRLAKYWEIDDEINQMQQKVCSLEEEFGEGRIIEDDEARNVMAATALKSCKETLVWLQEKQERSVMETEVEQKRIEDAREKLISFKNEFVLDEFGPENSSAGEDEECEATKKGKDTESLEVESLSVAEMEEKIDELVNKVLDLETAVSSQSAIIERLRVETDELQAQIQALEVDKCALIDRKNHLNVHTLASANEGSVSHETSKPSEKCEDRITVQASPMTEHTLSEGEHERGPEDEPDWKKLFSKGVDNREKNLWMEYTTMLRNCKDTKKKLMEVETNNQNSLSDIMLQLKELKNSNAMKDKEILSLRRELNLARTGLSQNNNTDQHAEPRVSTENSMVSPTEEEVKEHIGVMLSDQSQTLSEIEEKFRMNIDELLNENLDFWFRFSTAVQQIPKFENGVKDLQAEISELDERRKQDVSGTVKSPIMSDVQPLYKHLTEVQSELNGWVERSLLLEDELKNRFSSLCDIQEEITKELKASAAEDEFRFTSYQAAKFQGEILNMKQENNKVAEELQAGLDDARTLQLEVERSLAKLTEDWDISGSTINPSGQLQHSDSRNRVPLRSFIFGIKPKKQKTSLFSRVHPALHRKYTGLRSLYSSK